ncbi:MAG TPA: hypothetical protein VD932_02695 [Aquabacterium sp.]|nr:hypothetical protein [Aquabacterium sp.]
MKQLTWKWGDKVKAALEKVGVTPERFQALTGESGCNCKRRQMLLNGAADAVEAWAGRVLGRLRGDKPEHEEEIAKDVALQELEAIVEKPIVK